MDFNNNNNTIFDFTFVFFLYLNMLQICQMIYINWGRGRNAFDKSAAKLNTSSSIFGHYMSLICVQMGAKFNAERIFKVALPNRSTLGNFCCLFAGRSSPSLAIGTSERFNCAYLIIIRLLWLVATALLLFRCKLHKTRLKTIASLHLQMVFATTVDPFSFHFTFMCCSCDFCSNDAAIFQFRAMPSDQFIHSSAVPSKSRRWSGVAIKKIIKWTKKSAAQIPLASIWHCWAVFSNLRLLLGHIVSQSQHLLIAIQFALRRCWSLRNMAKWVAAL